MRNSKTKYTKEKLAEAVKNSKCYSDILKYFKLNGSSSMLAYFKLLINRYQICIKHFDLGDKKRLVVKEILVENRHGGRRENGPILRRAMLAYGFKYECCICKQGDSWQGQKLCIEIDHINGIPTDNRPENLRFMCPNCHSQAETSSKSEKYIPKYVKKCATAIKICENCQKEFLYFPTKQPKRKFCSNYCAGTSHLKKLNFPPIDEILVKLKTKNRKDVAKELNVTPRQLRKYLKSNGVYIPSKYSPWIT